MRLVNHAGRAGILVSAGVIDLEQASGGRFRADPMAAIAMLDEVAEFARTLDGSRARPLRDESELGPCVPAPRNVFGIGLNYRDHAIEAGLEIPQQPLVFTKFPSCLAGPRAPIVLSGDRVDYEAELVVVIGRGGRRIAERDAFAHVAGVCVGQDISDRRLQFADRPPQFSLGKSFDGYGPIGPALVTLDEAGSPDALSIRCTIGGERLQDGNTRDMLFGVSALIAFLSNVCTLAPGDLIFSGTPAGVGSARRRYLVPGDRIETEIEGLGRLVNDCVAG